MSDSLSRARELAAQLRRNLQTVLLATASAEGEPDGSVAAALLDDDGVFHIYVSGLAAHTRNLTANARASVLLVEDEAVTRLPLARRRLTFACTVGAVPRASPEFARLAARFREKFGGTIDLLVGLPDFQFVRLVPRRGRLVAGFGEAYEVDPLDWSRLSPIGRPGGDSPRPARS